MKLILYSNPNNGILKKLESEIFPKGFNVVFGYMPADGNDPGPEFTPFWKELAKKHKAEFVYIDNSKKPSKDELKNIMRVNSLSITGGNVFALLHNIRTTGFDKIIERLSQKENFIYSGFSAGAMIVTPDIKLAAKEYGWAFGYDENNVYIKDTKALGFVDFEILPHYNPEIDGSKLIKYREINRSKIKPLTDLEYIVMKKE